jgi:mitofusin
MEGVQEAYLKHKDQLAAGLAETRSLIVEFRKFNKSSWVVRYPHINPSTATPINALRRALSFADEPSNSTEVLVSKRGLQRSITVASIKEDASAEAEAEGTEASNNDFQVLRLDLKMGAGGASPASLVSQLEKNSIANLLDDRFDASIKHVDKLQTRIQDTSSKVLVTGDLNAGKSTLVNALLRRDVMPVDQQPCTTMFCEVIDAAENDGVEEVHIVNQGMTYAIQDESTFTRADLKDLEGIVTESDAEHVLKMYVKDARQPNESLLHNGIVDIALIDAPGLNRDSLKTTAVFARQEEIDVIVFVVSAENHFTLSAKEFLLNASREKAYVFIVVNRFDQIKDKARCKRLVLEQIKALSPNTYANSDELVHFVAAEHAEGSESFKQLEADLRSFVLVKRSKSKLAPASTYLEHLLDDLNLLANSNAILARSELDQAKAKLNRSKPVYDQLRRNRDGLEDDLETEEEKGATKAACVTKEMLTKAIEKVGQGELPEGSGVTLPSYPGLLHLWEYARDVRKTFLTSLDSSVKLAEDEARVTTTAGVNAVGQMAEKYLPEGVERSRRIFMPEAMFSPKMDKRSKRRSSTRVAGGSLNLGLGLAQRQELSEVTFFDVFDAQHHFWAHFSDEDAGNAPSSKDHLSSALTLASAGSVASLGLGALTMAGGNVGGVLEGLVKLSEVLGNEDARKWAAPIMGALTLGLTVWFIHELPNSVPKNVGRRVKKELLAKEEEGEEAWVDQNAARISRETRKVLRLVAWDLKERFRGAMEASGKEVKGAEEAIKVAAAAGEFLENVVKKTEGVRGAVGL